VVPPALPAKGQPLNPAQNAGVLVTENNSGGNY